MVGFSSSGAADRERGPRQEELSLELLVVGFGLAGVWIVLWPVARRGRAGACVRCLQLGFLSLVSPGFDAWLARWGLVGRRDAVMVDGTDGWIYLGRVGKALVYSNSGHRTGTGTVSHYCYRIRSTPLCVRVVFAGRKPMCTPVFFLDKNLSFPFSIAENGK